MSGIVQTVTYDQATNQLIDSSNVSAVILTTTYPQIFRDNEHAIIRATIYSDASQSQLADLSGMTFSACIGSPGATGVIAVDNAAFNQVADWATVNPATGKICFYIDTSTAAVDTALGTYDFKTYLCHIMATDGDDRTVALFNLRLINTCE